MGDFIERDYLIFSTLESSIVARPVSSFGIGSHEIPRPLRSRKECLEKKMRALKIRHRKSSGIKRPPFVFGQIYGVQHRVLVYREVCKTGLADFALPIIQW